MAIYLEKWTIIYTAKEAICMISKIMRKMSWMGKNMIASILEGSWVKQPKQCLVKWNQWKTLWKHQGGSIKVKMDYQTLATWIMLNHLFSSKEWENKINEKRQQLLQGQMSIESNQDDDNINFDQSDTWVFNDVKIVDS